ncbi:SRPBCC domain-containing protein [Maricaulis sp.]|uniref:SRPBCC family protein n=1 Tax=Maricaulis sp. TaxID=1486257 RepID=UPI002B2721A0|nr:SRPBCC domain-containing protein [Maricaulis sp.]
MTEARIEKSVFLKASPDRVWDYLTRPELLARWFHPADTELVTDAAYSLLSNSGDGSRVCWGEVLEADPHNRLVYSFTHKWLDGHLTRVEWTLTAVAEGTLLKLVHDGFEGARVDVFDSLCDHDAGWDEHFAKLRDQVLAADLATV